MVWMLAFKNLPNWRLSKEKIALLFCVLIGEYKALRWASRAHQASNEFHALPGWWLSGDYVRTENSGTQLSNPAEGQNTTVVESARPG